MAREAVVLYYSNSSSVKNGGHQMAKGTAKMHAPTGLRLKTFPLD
jgi:hypothetical protein